MGGGYSHRGAGMWLMGQTPWVGSKTKVWLVQSAVPALVPFDACRDQDIADLAPGDGRPNFLTLGLCAQPIFQDLPHHHCSRHEYLTGLSHRYTRQAVHRRLQDQHKALCGTKAEEEEAPPDGLHAGPWREDIRIQSHRNWHDCIFSRARAESMTCLPACDEAIGCSHWC